MYNVESYHSFPCFSYSSCRFSWNIVSLFSLNNCPSCLSLQSSLKASFLSWYISAHSLSSSSFGSKLSCYRSLIHGSSLHLLFSSSFTPDSVQEFPDDTPWMIPIFNCLPFILFTVDIISPSQNSPSSYIPFH